MSKTKTAKKTTKATATKQAKPAAKAAATKRLSALDAAAQVLSASSCYGDARAAKREL